MAGELEHRVLEEIQRLRREMREALRRSPAALLSKIEVADLLNVSVRTVERLVAAGELPPGRLVGRQRRWSREEILDSSKKRR